MAKQEEGHMVVQTMKLRIKFSSDLTVLIILALNSILDFITRLKRLLAIAISTVPSTHLRDILR